MKAASIATHMRRRGEPGDWIENGGRMGREERTTSPPGFTRGARSVAGPVPVNSIRTLLVDSRVSVAQVVPWSGKVFTRSRVPACARTHARYPWISARPTVLLDIPAPFGRLPLSASQASRGVRREEASMRYTVLACLLGLALAFDLGVLIATSDDSFGSFDPYRPATLVPLVASRLDALEAQVRKVDVRAFLDALVSGSGEPDRHQSSTPGP